MSELVSLRLVKQVLPSKEEFLRAIRGDKRLRFYFGIDPTTPDLHLGHAVALWFLRDMQRLGHEVIVLLGDFTAEIGDPAGKDTTRRALRPEEVSNNMRSYRRQIGMILPLGKTQNPAKLMRNSKWLGRLRLPDVIRLASHATVQQFLERDMFQRRLKEQKPIALHEFLYPLLQGYDSVVLDADVEVGGADQLFNMMVGKKLREAELGKSKFVVALRLLENPETGKKMSKSEGDYVPLSASPDDLYGKVMALPDGMVWPCFELATDMPDDEIHALRQETRKGKSMREIKAALAERIVTQLHGVNQAKQASEKFQRITKGAPEIFDVEPIRIEAGTKEKAVDFVARVKNCSRSQASRLIEGGAVHLYEKNTGKIIPVRMRDELIEFDTYQYIRIGKKKTENFYKIEILFRT